jgi:radical SAM superfamily enzyme YgiQ (UPF0313 family)
MPLRVLLVIPRFVEARGRSYDFPLGIAYVAAALTAAGHRVRGLNLNNRDESPDEAVRREVLDFDPDVVGTGGLVAHFEKLKAIVAAAKGAKPSAFAVVGGGAIGGDPEACAGLLGVDAGVIGEGDRTVVDLMEALETGRPLVDVAGIVIPADGGGWVRTASRPPIKDLDALPWPDLEAFGIDELLANQFPLDNYFFNSQDRPRALPMVASRSCPYDCSFCFHPTGRVYRMRGLDSVFAELDARIERHRINLVAFLDEIFAVKKSRIMEFCERIRGYGLQWMVQLHPSTVDAECLAAMKEAGCTYISYGLESMDQAVLDNMRKKSTLAEIETALRLTREVGIGIQGNFIFGEASETLASANRTLDWWARNRRYQVNLYMIQVFPGSQLYREAIARKAVPDLLGLIANPWVNVSGLSDEDYRRLSHRLTVLSEGLLRPAPIDRFEAVGTPHPIRGPLYRVGWTCPECGHANVCENLALGHALDPPALRMTCKGCFGRFSIVNQAKRFRHEPEIDAAVAEAEMLRKAGRIEAAANACLAVMRKHLPARIANFGSASWIRGAVEMGALFRELGRTKEAIYLLSHALAANPWDPRHHLEFANALVAEGSLDAARCHIEQAALLVGEGTERSAALRTFAAGLVPASEGEPTYLV